jgi:ATP phosphoribosyltransferase regulatory subunit
LVATRFRDRQDPIRLCYEGTVVRLEKRDRSQREIIQAGIEVAGLAGPGADAEIIALGAEALAAVGFGAADITIDLGHLGLAAEVLNALGLPEETRTAVRGRLAKRDVAGLAALLSGFRIPGNLVEFTLSLPGLSGSPDVIDRALRTAPSGLPGIRRALLDLRAVTRALAPKRLPGRLHVDLGEVRGWDYYTGVRVQGFVHGAPDAILAGGRYDDLLARYGRPAPAVGFAIDVEATAAALEAAVPFVDAALVNRSKKTKSARDRASRTAR